MPERAKPLLEWRKAKAESLSGLERRLYSGEMELREADDGTLQLTGYAAVFDTPYEVGFYTETVRRSAFDRTLSESPDVVLLVGHEGLPLARTKAGTLRLSVDSVGLHVDADLDPEDPDTRTLKRKRDRGDLDGQMSMAFQVTAQRWDDEYLNRELLSVGLNRGDVSVVVHGASPTTSSSIRSADAALALHDIGGEGVVRAFREWRDYTLVPFEQRAGKKLSAATTEVLTQVLNLVAAADDALDEAQPLLAELLGVENPDTTDDGEAETVERSITSEKTLGAAIRAVVREPGQDERRAEVIQRARELDLGGMIPDAWTAAGALADGTEKRETYNDTYTALQGVLDDLLVANGDYYYVWIQDFDESSVYYVVRGELYRAAYTLVPGGECTIDVGEAVKVRPVTEYVARSAEAEPGLEVRSGIGVPLYVLPDYTTRARQQFDLRRIKDGGR